MLDNLSSIINQNTAAFDNLKPFTYIEFIKMGGLDNESNSFTDLYSEYLNLWASAKKYNTQEDIDLFVKGKMIDLLKSITITYTSYEEKDFISNLDWENDDHIKAVIPFFIRKIREITEFYREKRNNISQIVRKNSFQGSTKSIEEIIYDAIFNFAFAENYNLQIKEIKKDILISIENYVDTYSEYFDIPRTETPSLESRQAMITANMNDVDYRNYLEVNSVVADLIYDGYVFLKEIPLVARVAMDLSQNCVGDMLQIKNALLAASTISQVELTEQIALRRRLYEKFLGCDLYYLFCDENGKTTMDLLVRASNPSGNLLNCSNPDTATVESGQLELLSHIGLFFKPDKTSILKINTKNFSWEVDEDNLIPSTIYIFPDPNKYGQIGNNKETTYPLIMDYRLDADIKNLSSGYACDDPLILLDEAAMTAYYSKQQDDFKLYDNKKYEYAFTALQNRGFVYDFQRDIYGNQFALFKGFEVIYEEKIDPETGEVIKVPTKVNISSKYGSDAPANSFEKDSGNTTSKALIINGGYFEDPNYPGRKDENGNYIAGKPFNFDVKERINDYYQWTSLKLSQDPNFIVRPAQLFNMLNFGTFDQPRNAIYKDNYGVSKLSNIKPTGSSDNNIIEILVNSNQSQIIDENTVHYDGYELEVVSTEKSFIELQQEKGTLFIKDISSMDKKPYKLLEGMPWLQKYANENGNLDIKNFQISKKLLCLELENRVIFVPYSFAEGTFSDDSKLSKIIDIPFKNNRFYSRPLFVEKNSSFYIIELEEYLSESGKCFLPNIFKIDVNNYTLSEVFNSLRFLKNTVNPKTKNPLLAQYDSLIFGNELNLCNFKVRYGAAKLNQISFSYNGNLDIFLLSYIYYDDNNNPYIYEHKFKVLDDETLNSTITTNVYSFHERSYFYSEHLSTGYSESVVNNKETLGDYFFIKVFGEEDEEDTSPTLILNLEDVPENSEISLANWIDSDHPEYYECNIEWGDSEQTKISSSEANWTHTYQNGGNYTVSIKGKFDALGNGVRFYPNKKNNDIRHYLTSVDVKNSSPLKIVKQPFSCCYQLKSVAKNIFFNVLSDESDFTCCFEYTAIETIDSEIFSKQESVRDFSFCFIECINLKTLPDNLFANCPFIESIYGMFSYCYSLETIGNILGNVPRTDLTRAECAFYDTTFKNNVSTNGTLLKYCFRLTNMSNVYYANTRFETADLNLTNIENFDDFIGIFSTRPKNLYLYDIPFVSNIKELLLSITSNQYLDTSNTMNVYIGSTGYCEFYGLHGPEPMTINDFSESDLEEFRSLGLILHQI